MGDVVQTLLAGKSRKAEDVLGWNRQGYRRRTVVY